MTATKAKILAKSHRNDVRAGRKDIEDVAVKSAELEKKAIEERTGEKLSPTEERRLANKNYQNMIYGVRGD